MEAIGPFGLSVLSIKANDKVESLSASCPESLRLFSTTGLRRFGVSFLSQELLLSLFFFFFFT